MTQARTPPSKLLVAHPTSVARRLLWRPFSLDTATLHKPDHHKSFEKPGAHLFWVVSGTGTLEIEGHQYALKPGPRVWFVDMTKPRTYTPLPGSKLVKRGIRFGGPGLEIWHEQLGGSLMAEFALEDEATIQLIYRKIWQLVKCGPDDWEWQVHLLLTRILGMLLASRKLLSRSHVEVPLPVVRVLNAIACNPFHDWSVKDLAVIAGVSYSGLRTQFHESQKIGLHDFIQRNRLDQARLLLSDLRLSIKQIAAQLHFSSEFYFSHFFKKWGGMPPSDFRRQLGAGTNR